MAVGLIQQVDTTTIFNQYESWFETFTAEETAAFEAWFETIQDILDENVAAQLLAMIETKQATITAVGMLKGEGDGNIVPAVPDVDYATIQYVNDKPFSIMVNGILKGDGSGRVMAAVPNTDYAPATYKAPLSLYVNISSGSDSNDGKTASTAFKSINRLQTEINKYDTYLANLTVTISPGTYTDSILLVGKTFHTFNITASGSASETRMGEILLWSCTGRIDITRLSFQKLSFVSTTAVIINGCLVDGVNRSLPGVQCETSNIEVISTTINNCSFAIYSNRSIVLSRANSGGSNNYGLGSFGGFILKSGNQPSGSTAENKQDGGQIFS